MHRRAITAFLVLLSALLLAAVAGVPGAGAAEPIEGVWSFNGGEVAVQSLPDGSLVGTVVAPTKFSECLHPVGERVWTNISRQPDGSYWGDHQWYFQGAECVPNPTLGLTAWRVLQGPSGGRFLRVCFSEPGSSSQPTIAADGTDAGVTFGCSDSSLIAPLPAVAPSEAESFVHLVDNRSCLGRRRLRVKLRDPVGDPFAKVEVTLRSGSLARRAKLKRGDGFLIATLRLAGLKAATFTVRVEAQTVLGRTLSLKRTYHRCRRPHRGAARPLNLPG